MTDAEKTFTLEEARKELARLECFRHGHDWNIVTWLGQETPSAITCNRCGRTHGVLA
jgi:hypothetical protein